MIGGATWSRNSAVSRPGIADDRRVQIRQETSADHQVIRELVEAAFKSPVEAQLVEDIRASQQFIPELALVADQGGRIVGHVMISYVWIENEGVRRRVPSLSPLAVAPESQGNGVGSALVRTVTAAAADRGEPLVVLEGSPLYYGRFGFEDARKHGIEFKLPSWAPPDAGQVLRLAGYHPALRGRVVYPPAFDAASQRD